MKRLWSFFVVTALVGAALAFACSDPTLESYCTGIPTGGCPSDDPSTCVHDAGPDGAPGDPTCAAIYTHSPSCVWTLVQTCPGFVPAKDAARPHDAADATSDVHPKLRDAGFTLPEGAGGGGDACIDLESPDCPLELALECGDTCCGCETLYVCSSSGWSVWGECVDGGVMASPSP